MEEEMTWPSQVISYVFFAPSCTSLSHFIVVGQTFVAKSPWVITQLHYAGEAGEAALNTGVLTR
jgi:hypothetical protein